MPSASVDKIDPVPLSPIYRDAEVELLADELEFNQFLLYAAKWLCWAKMSIGERVQSDNEKC